MGNHRLFVILKGSVNMSELSNKVSYLRGFCDGASVDFSDNEGKVIKGLLEITEEMTKEIDRLSVQNRDLANRVEDLEEDAAMLIEEMLSDDRSEDDELFEDDDEFDDFDDFDEDDDDTTDLFEIQCPECGEDFMIDYDEILDGEDIVCPHCSKEIQLEIDCDDDDISF